MLFLFQLLPIVSSHAVHSRRSYDQSDVYRQWLKRQTPVQDPCLVDQSATIAPIIQNFPPPFQTAFILPNDQEARQTWDRIRNNATLQEALAIRPKGTNNGNFAGVTYDFAADPDCWWTGSQCKVSRRPYIPADTYTCPQSLTWGLTFDDGPSCGNARLYDFLKEHNQLATMFYIGSNVLSLPQQAQRGGQDGHELCHHSWSHQYTTSMTNEQVFAELYYSIKVIKQVVGVTVTCWRSPFGDVDDRVRAIASALGLATVLWDNDTDDWEIDEQGRGGRPQIDRNFQAIYGNASTQHGTVVLDHELSSESGRSIFIDHYPRIQQHFQHIVPVATCQDWTQPYRDLPAVVYPTFAQYTTGNRASAFLTPAITTVSNARLDLSFQAAAPQPLPPASNSSSSAGSKPTGGAVTAAQDKSPASKSQAKGFFAAAVAALLLSL